MYVLYLFSTQFFFSVEVDKVDVQSTCQFNKSNDRPQFNRKTCKLFS